MKNKQSLSLHNKTKYWFKAKKYGYGWSPASWEGWVVLGIFVILMMVNAYRLGIISQSFTGNIIGFFLENFILIGILIMICYKTGEKPMWRLGKRK